MKELGGDMVGEVVGLYDDLGLEYRGVNKSGRQEAPFAFAWRMGARRRKLPPSFATRQYSDRGFGDGDINQRQEKYECDLKNTRKRRWTLGKKWEEIRRRIGW
jgi:hypothetical protein